MSEYYRIARQGNTQKQIKTYFYKASTNRFVKNEKSSSRYHRLDAATVRDDVKSRFRAYVYLVESN